MAITEDAAPAKAARWTAQWKELYDEVITTGLCTGCAGCVIACPHDVIGYEHDEGEYKPFHLEEELGPDDCIHGEKGCTTLHPGLPPVPRVGARGRQAPVRPGARARRDGRHLPGHPADPGRPTTTVHEHGPGRRLRVGDADLAARARLHRRRARRRTSRATTATGRPSPASPPTGTRCWPPPAAATRTRPTRWPSTRRIERGPRAAGAGRHGLPDVGRRR